MDHSLLVEDRTRFDDCDPVYSGKGAARTIDPMKSGAFDGDENIIARLPRGGGPVRLRPPFQSRSGGCRGAVARVIRPLARATGRLAAPVGDGLSLFGGCARFCAEPVADRPRSTPVPA